MITSQSAKEMLVVVGELLELCGKYWSSYRSLPNLDSPQEAWALYDDMRQKQKVIAQKLDKDALDIKRY